MDSKMRRNIWIWGVTIVLVVAALAATYISQKGESEKKRAADIQQAIEKQAREYPIPAVVKTVSGIVKGVYGATIHLEIDDPQDIIPHTDGTPRRKLLVFASLLSDTRVLLVDLKHLDARGNPNESALDVSGIREGDSITVTTNSNIVESQRFDVSRVEKTIR
jgi:hypothetical protein